MKTGKAVMAMVVTSTVLFSFLGAFASPAEAAKYAADGVYVNGNGSSKKTALTKPQRIAAGARAAAGVEGTLTGPWYVCDLSKLSEPDKTYVKEWFNNVGRGGVVKKDIIKFYTGKQEYLDAVKDNQGGYYVRKGYKNDWVSVNVAIMIHHNNRPTLRELVEGIDKYVVKVKNSRADWYSKNDITVDYVVQYLWR